MEFLFLAFPLMTSSFADVKGKQHLSVEINCDFRQLNCGSVMQMCLWLCVVACKGGSQERIGARSRLDKAGSVVWQEDGLGADYCTLLQRGAHAVSYRAC